MITTLTPYSNSNSLAPEFHEHTMSKVNDAGYLRDRQYKDSRNLEARIAIHVRYSTSNAGGWESIFDWYDFPADARVLEIGCGTGMLWVTNKARIPAGWRITLTDFSEGMLAQSQRNLAEAAMAERVVFQQADAQALPFPDRGFDVVIANMMLYHVPNRPKAYAEIKRVLAGNGTLYAVTVGREHMSEIHRLAQMFEDRTGIVIGQWGRDMGTDDHFTVESGEPELRQHFGPIALHHFRSHLHVTDVEPLVDYMLSTSTDPAAHRAPLTQFIREQMNARGGAIDIPKHTAMMVAHQQV